ncbi:murein L,D-transpeptidase YcbB/YkuD [Roseiarcus fermentans]|uniref:Murein L,D-transpeptidase YcbB/YkuD n=1 Tax=Roseiarcus fermentans TaxID=1473586 RepID=A0A366FK00_9HYPH|nr:L,D-transpeptidase family protein [Roseiarcus fermentans]RBP14039.1 murein L,D-transpeptidase YcbB/YkuD [Roseiarcus fermentans]
MRDTNVSRSSRRLLLGAAMGALALAGLIPLAARAADADGQAEWPQSYEASPRMAIERESTPILSAATVDATQAAIQKYQDIVTRGGWSAVPPGADLRIGSKGARVQALRLRLVASGDLDAEAGAGPVYDSFVEAAVKRFQARHGLSQTGAVGEGTIAELNVSAAARLQQLETNIVRLKTFSGDLGQRYVVANIPAAEVETVENGVVYSHHAAGVGKIDRQSPIMQTRATEINFNPFWTVPPSLIKKDLIPKMKADPNYLTDEKIRIFNGKGEEVSPTSINWNTEEATHFKYRQDTGADLNSLGIVRINIPNPYGVYMHDTPSKGIFGDDFRFVSSGCIRVQDVRDYVAWLLKDNPGWGRDQIDEVIRSGQRLDVKLTQPVNVYWVYITAWATPDGVVQFRPDVYQRDGSGPGPLASAVPAQPMAIPQE